MSKLRTGEGLHERYQIVDFVVGQPERPDPAAEVVVHRIILESHTTIVVMLYHVIQCFKAAVVHVRRGHVNVAQGGCLESPKTVKASRDGEATEPH